MFVASCWFAIDSSGERSQGFTPVSSYVPYFTLFLFFRHSGIFYKIFSTPVDLRQIHHSYMDTHENIHNNSNNNSYGDSPIQTVLSVLSAYCGDSDPSTRKFASFAGTPFTQFFW